MYPLKKYLRHLVDRIKRDKAAITLFSSVLLIKLKTSLSLMKHISSDSHPFLRL